MCTRRLFRVAVLLLTAMVALLGRTSRVTAGPVTVAFTYTFGSGQTLSGTVGGDLQPDGDLVSNLTDLQAVFSSAPGSPFTFFSVAFPGDLSLTGLQVFGFTGFVSSPDTPIAHSDFGFDIEEFGFPVSNSAVVGTFHASAGLGDFGFPRDGERLAVETFNADLWSTSVSPDQSAAVPEPSSLVISSILLGMVGAVWTCKRMNRPAAG
jgi:hypothetical protein